MPPLNLEEATQDTYLETFIELDGNRFNHRLKNTFEKRADLTWKYKDYHSFNPRAQKRGLVAGIFMKLDLMASDDSQFWRSLHAKAEELQRSRYPRSLLREMCLKRAASLDCDDSRRWHTAAATIGA